MKKLSAALLIPLVIVSVLLVVYSSDIASLAWKKYKNADIALVLNRNGAPLAMELGDHYFGGQATVGTSGVYDLQKAELAYKSAIKIDPSILWGNYQLARVHLVQGRFDDALMAINKELEANPENLRALYIRGLIYGFRLRTGDLERAEIDFRRFIEWAPTEWAGYNDLNWVLLEQEKYQEVKAISEQAFDHVLGGESNPWILNSLGVAHLNLEEYELANSVFGQALMEAESLTEADWYRAYTGNSPESAAGGLESFKEGIRKNLERAQEAER